MEGDVRSSSSDEISDSSENARPIANGTPKKNFPQINGSNHSSPKKSN